MSTEPQPKLARRVVTGVNDEGNSVIVSDAETPTWVRRPTGTVVMDVWRADSLPAHVDDEPSQDGELVLAPAVGGVCVRIAVFPPDKDVDAESAAAYEAAMHQLYGDQGDAAPGGVPGMHRTETIDVVAVVDGEIWLVLEEGDTLLRAGDTHVQRGTRHAWKNRSDRPCTLASTMLPAIRT
jgi:hypothetical protein